MAEPHPGESTEALLRDRNLWLIFAIALVSVMGTTPIAPAFPDISRHFHVPEQRVGLVITFYTFGGLALSVVEGLLADRFGRKLILIPSLILFGAGGALCTTAGSFHSLLLWRGIQGIGGAAAPFMYTTLLGDLYRGRRRTQAVGYAGSALSMGTMLYPLAGGTLALLGWYFPFFLPLLAIPVAVAAAFLLKNPEPRPRQTLRQYLRRSWEDISRPELVWLYVCYAMTAFLYFGGYLTHFSFLMRHLFHAGTLETGGIFSITALAVALTSWQLRPLKDRIGRHNIITFSYLLFAAGFFIVPLIHSQWLMIVPAVLLGIAWGSNTPSIRDLVAASAPTERRAISLSLTGLSLRVGHASGPVAGDSVLGAWGINGIFWFSGILSLLMFLLAFVAVRRHHAAKSSLDEAEQHPAPPCGA